MGRITETTSKRWKVKGNPKDPEAKWDGGEWLSQQPPLEDKLDLKTMEKWVEDMGDWCEMMHESMIELRERVSAIEGLRQDVYQLGEVVKSLNPPPRPPAGRPT